MKEFLKEKIKAVYAFLLEWLKSILTKEKVLKAFESVFSTSGRYIVISAIGFAAFFYLQILFNEKTGNEVAITALSIPLFWAIAVVLINLGIYVITNVKFVKILLQGDDGKYSAYERLGVCIVMAAIILGTMLLSSIAIVGIFYVLYS